MALARPPDRIRATAPPGGRAPAVAAASALALAMWAFRARLAGPDLGFLLWNLALAWIPWVAARGVTRARTRLSRAAAAAVWLLFLPNAPYLVTDLVHLRPRPPVPATYDMLLFASFALAGCALGWGSLETVHARLAHAAGRARAALAVAAVLLLTGFGVYLGRFGRWNSWDLLAQPRGVLADAAAALGEPRALAFSALFAAFVGAGYLLVAAAPAAGRRTEPPLDERAPSGYIRTSPQRRERATWPSERESSSSAAARPATRPPCTPRAPA